MNLIARLKRFISGSSVPTPPLSPGLPLYDAITKAPFVLSGTNAANGVFPPLKRTTTDQGDDLAPSVGKMTAQINPTISLSQIRIDALEHKVEALARNNMDLIRDKNRLVAARETLIDQNNRLAARVGELETQLGLHNLLD